MKTTITVEQRIWEQLTLLKIKWKMDRVEEVIEKILKERKK